MGGSYQYVMLVCSLPAHPANLFKARQTTISRLRLDKRLKLLEPRHQRDLDLIEEVVHWSHLPMGLTDEEFLGRARELYDRVESSFVKDIVTFRLEIRSIVAALRRRKRELGPPGLKETWGCEHWLPAIHRNWRQADFGLGRVLPWVATAHKLLEAGDCAGLQRLQMDLNWNHLRQISGGHTFDFEAVVIYVMRWDMIDRWVRYDGQAAEVRFQKLVEEGMGKFGEVLNTL